MRVRCGCRRGGFIFCSCSPVERFLYCYQGYSAPSAPFVVALLRSRSPANASPCMSRCEKAARGICRTAAFLCTYRFCAQKILQAPFNTFLAPAPPPPCAVPCLPGFFEEVLFRGVIQQWLGGVIGALPALGITSVLFGLAHSPVPGASSFTEACYGANFGLLYMVGRHL